MTQELHSTSIPAHLGERANRGYNIRYIVGGLLLLAFVAFLGMQMVQGMTTGAYFMTVSELRARAATLDGQLVRVNGNVVEGTEDWNAADMVLKFSIKDEKDGEILPIVFYGVRPDNFQRAASAIIEGQLQPDGTFEANNLLLKCPSRYEEEPSEVYVESVRK